MNESNICASGATLGDEVIPAEAVVSTASKALTLARRANCKWPTRALTYPLWGCEVILHDEGVFACAAGYVGRKRHASFRHRFPSVDARTTFIEAWVAKHRAEAEAAALEKEIVSKARAEKPAFAVGDVLYSTWGWEQTPENLKIQETIAKIFPEEAGHVRWGNRWLAKIAQKSPEHRQKVEKAKTKYSAIEQAAYESGMDITLGAELRRVGHLMEIAATMPLWERPQYLMERLLIMVLLAQLFTKLDIH